MTKLKTETLSELLEKFSDNKIKVRSFILIFNFLKQSKLTEIFIFNQNFLYLVGFDRITFFESARYLNMQTELGKNFLVEKYFALCFCKKLSIKIVFWIMWYFLYKSRWLMSIFSAPKTSSGKIAPCQNQQPAGRVEKLAFWGQSEKCFLWGRSFRHRKQTRGKGRHSSGDHQICEKFSGEGKPGLGKFFAGCG